MKTVYICEKCGSRHENYEAAIRCEECHLTFSTKYDRVLEPKYKWGKDGSLPTLATLAVMGEVYDPAIGSYKSVQMFGRYQLKAVVPEDRVAEILLEYEAEEAKDRAEWEAYIARRVEAKKAEKAAEEESASVGE